MLIKVCKYGSEDDVISTLPIGRHVIGRGNILQCNDKRVSRQHAVIDIGESTATITALHSNPCFFMAANSKTITILPRDSPHPLQHGDKFALLPDDLWFKVKIVEDDDKSLDNNNTDINSSEPSVLRIEQHELVAAAAAEDNDEAQMDSSSSSLVKRQLEDDDETINQDSDNKRVKLIDDDLTSRPSSSGLHFAPTQVEVKLESDNSTSTVLLMKEEVITDEGGIVESAEDENLVKQEDQSLVAGPSSSGGNSLPEATSSTVAGGTSDEKKVPSRERCWYAPACYRKNPTHKADYSHPGDADYDDVTDDRPVCSYGAACYRKNAEHRRDYKHPPRSPSANRPTNQRKRTRRNNDDDLNETPEDDYDYEDPFIDDSGDEYVGEPASSDSDVEESQDHRLEEDEDTELLIKEAKDFTK